MKDNIEVVWMTFLWLATLLMIAWPIRAISKEREVEKARIEVIEKLSPSISMKGDLLFTVEAYAPNSRTSVIWIYAYNLSPRAFLVLPIPRLAPKIFLENIDANKVLNVAQKNDIVTQHGLLALVFAFKKFRSYFLGTKVADQLSRLEEKTMVKLSDGVEIEDTFPDERRDVNDLQIGEGFREAGGLRDKDMISSSNIQNIAKFPTSQVALAQKHDMSDD
ncbi:hypothetical protein H5410_026729 [Solanum commersonii]|uniref:Uncharacterized protein n=1 Tax=Solanum commersonii TaxID=4109 RepID=A0A9J5YZC4_SOLCO|nr:hypothetical protein H5410_026729 [Solanum commersonii]